MNKCWKGGGVRLNYQKKGAGEGLGWGGVGILIFAVVLTGRSRISKKGQQPQRVGVNLLFSIIFAENSMNMIIKNGLRGEHASLAPHRSTNGTPCDHYIYFQNTIISENICL